MNQISKKVVLVGHFNVGKTSLTRRFVHSKFSENYLTTIGVNIEKKEVRLNNSDVTMIIWDLAGEDSLKKSQQSFIKGAHGVIYVFDLTRESTYTNIEEQIKFLKEILPDTKISVIGNKMDLLSKDESLKVRNSISIDCNYLSSAKTGENVETMFMELAGEMLC